LSPDVSFIALTATATLDTKKFILDTLCMNNPVEVQESPNKKNVMYSVTYIQQSHRIDDTFQWIVDEIINMGSSAERVIIYCQTIKQCSVVYSKLRACLGEHFHSGQSVESAVLEMLHSCTPQANKDNIIKSFQDPNGTVKALVATIAFGMGIDCKRVHTSVHFGPPKNVESYIQESGRIGRDGQLSKSYIIYQGILLGHVENNIKEYLKTTECRRKSLLSHFGISLGNVQSPQPAHLCCDNCALNCMCGMTQCKSYSIYPGILANPSQLNVELPISNVIREVTSTHYQKLKEELVKFQKKLLMDVIGKVSMGQMHLHIPPQMVIGFGQVQMNQVLEHCGSIFSVDDVYKFVEIWHHNHAHSIYLMLCNVFDNNEDTCITGACNLLIPTFDDDDDNVDEEDINDEWACFLDDSDLLNMALENLSISHLNDNDSNENIEESF
jgi:ATP-dependent DNA helicase RecQ